MSGKTSGCCGLMRCSRIKRTADAMGIRRCPPAVRSASIVPSSIQRLTDDSLTPSDWANWRVVNVWRMRGFSVIWAVESTNLTRSEAV